MAAPEIFRGGLFCINVALCSHCGNGELLSGNNPTAYRGFLTPTALWAAFVRNGNLPRPKEALNQSPSAEQRIFFPARAASKAGNTYSIPPLLNPSFREKSLAVSSRRLNQRFLKCPPDTFYPAAPGRPFDSRTGNHAKIPVRTHRDFYMVTRTGIEPMLPP